MLMETLNTRPQSIVLLIVSRISYEIKAKNTIENDVVHLKRYMKLSDDIF